MKFLKEFLENLHQFTISPSSLLGLQRVLFDIRISVNPVDIATKRTLVTQTKQNEDFFASQHRKRVRGRGWWRSRNFNGRSLHCWSDLQRCWLSRTQFIFALELSSRFVLNQTLNNKHFCDGKIFSGSLWKFIEGESEGQTATDTNRLDPKAVFAHPIDLHLATRGIQGWPKLIVEVFSVNSLKQFYPVGVGFNDIPTKPGLHKLRIATWRIAPVNWLDAIREKFYTGGWGNRSLSHSSHD